MISEADIYRLQAHAIVTGNQHLRYLTYAALGHDIRIAMLPTTPEEKLRAMRGCTDQLQMLEAMGVKLKPSGMETVDTLITKTVDTGLPCELHAVK